MSVRARVLEHHWALTEPMASAAGLWTERRALLLVLEDAEGNVGLGEAAPLPGYSADTLELARGALRARMTHPLEYLDITRDMPSQLHELFHEIGSHSARFALESAALDLTARRARRPAWALLRETEPAPAELAQWLPDGTEAALAAARRAVERGVRAFKVKLDAGRDITLGLATLEALRAAFGRSVTLRADANRSATEATLEAHRARLQALELEWLEEPSAKPLAKSFDIPLALDESLQQANSDMRAFEQPDVIALVLKLTALGGLARCLELAGHGRAHSLASVASHALEGPVGFMGAAALALALDSKHAHGLGPHAALRSLRPPALAPERDQLLPWKAPGFGLSLEQALAGAVLDQEYVA